MPSPLPEALDSDMPSQEQWSPDEQPTDGLPPPHSNGTGDQMSQVLENDGVDYSRGGDGDDVGNDSKTGSPYRDQQHERQMKPNKVYIGGLPEHTRREDLQSCFGKIGTIVNIELKIGYGFVEFENIQAAEESVAKYNEGYFMGNKIRVEISRGGRQKYQSEPGACFKCGQMGHWARECPNHGTVSVPAGPYDPSVAHGVNRTRRPFHSHGAEPPLIDRIHPAREYPPPAPREYPTPPYREEYGRGYPPPPPPPRDARYGYDYPPPPSRDVRRASPPPAAYRPPPPPPRDYPPPPARTGRDYDDYRMRGPPPPPVRYDAPPPGYFPPERGPAGYPPSGYPPPPPRDYERYDKRTVPPPTERYGAYPPPGAVRPRTPPGVAPVRIPREEFERTVTPREYPGAPPPDFRGRPVTPPAARYADYVPPRAASPTGGAMRYRRRSQSPMTRSASGGVAYDPNYAPPPPERFNNGYSAPGVPPMPQRGGARDYAPRNGREVPDPNAGYRRA